MEGLLYHLKARKAIVFPSLSQPSIRVYRIPIEKSDFFPSPFISSPRYKDPFQLLPVPGDNAAEGK